MTASRPDFSPAAVATMALRLLDAAARGQPVGVSATHREYAGWRLRTDGVPPILVASRADGAPVILVDWPGPDWLGLIGVAAFAMVLSLALLVAPWLWTTTAGLVFGAVVAASVRVTGFQVWSPERPLGLPADTLAEALAQHLAGLEAA